MRPHISVLTLTVDDLARAFAFYRALGWTSDGIVGTEFEHGAVAFFDLTCGMKLALWPRASLAHDAGIVAGPRSSTEFSIGHNVASAADVERIMQRAAAAGASIVKPAGETFWGGYAGYFADPDGHLWEIVHNPAWQQPSV